MSVIGLTSLACSLFEVVFFCVHMSRLAMKISVTLDFFFQENRLLHRRAISQKILRRDSYFLRPLLESYKIAVLNKILQDNRHGLILLDYSRICTSVLLLLLL